MTMEDLLTRFTTELIGRIDGPLHFRLYIQPLMAVIFALRDGVKDAHAGRAAYGWALLVDSEHRRYLMENGWKGIRNVFLVAWVLDLVYQFIEIGRLRPIQGFFIAVLLAVVPYVLLRGPANRLLTGLRR
jgi:hypothetical protein